MTASAMTSSGGSNPEKYTKGAIDFIELDPIKIHDLMSAHGETVGALALLFALFGKTEKGLRQLAERLHYRLIPGNSDEVVETIDILAGNTAFYDDIRPEIKVKNSEGTEIENPSVEDYIEMDETNRKLHALRNANTSSDSLSRTWRLHRSLLAIALINPRIEVNLKETEAVE